MILCPFSWDSADGCLTILGKGLFLSENTEKGETAIMPRVYHPNDILPDQHSHQTARLCPVTPSPRRHTPRRRRRRGLMFPGFPLAAAIALTAAVILAAWDFTSGHADVLMPSESAAQPSPSHAPAQNPAQVPSAPTGNNTHSISVPGWIIQELLPVNEYSRPGDALPQVNGVVVHYVGNPGTTARQNRSFFANLAETHETYASSHFLVDMDGTVLQCVPLDEISYCSNDRNADTISIECCHPDDTGKFTRETAEALARLLDWLIETYGLEREGILRHHDVNGKDCPRYFVQNPEEWEAFLDRLTFKA